MAQAPDDAREKAVRDLIDRYFLTWSAKDIDRYGQCFMPQAVIQLTDGEGKLRSEALKPFLDSQREAHKANPNLKETAEKVDVRFENQLARVVVYWKLVKGGDDVEYGYDHYTIMQSGGQWRIANLIFYSTPPAK